MRNFGKIILILAIGLLGACGYWEGLNSTSEVFSYQGTINASTGNVPTSANIWVANRDENIYEQKKVDTPQHPDQDGVFKVSVFSKSHPASDPIEHWECGPLRILIEGDNIDTYYDSLTNDELKVLGQNSNGVWVLPDITVQSK